MIDSNIRLAAAQVKAVMLRRASRIQEYAGKLGAKAAGMPGDLSDDRAETMQKELTLLATKQTRDTLILAVYRYVLGITESIDEDDVGLNE